MSIEAGDLRAQRIVLRPRREAGAACKPIDEVVAATALSGISRPVVRFVPIGNVKG